jgi:tetratricopeptide (TPR) repeat protein
MTLSYHRRGSDYADKGEYDRAIADYSKAIELNPKDDDAYTGRAWSYFKAGKAAQGLPDAERSLELYPHNAHALDTRGHIFEALGRREEAIADYRRTLVLDPGEEGKEDLKRLGAPITDFANQGMSILKASDNLGGLFLSNAQAAFEAGLKVDAKDADCLYGRGLIKLKKGDTDGGNADITAAKAIDPRVAELWTSYYGIKSPRL